MTPGPGSYQIQLGVGEKQQFSISSLRTPAVRTFYHSDRKIFDVSKDAGCKYLLCALYSDPGPWQLCGPFGIRHLREQTQVSLRHVRVRIKFL